MLLALDSRFSALDFTEVHALIDQELLGILRCPLDGSALAKADAELVQRINRAVEAGQLKNVADQAVTKWLDGGLVRQAGDLVYPVVDGIPVLLPDEGILLESIAEP